MAPAAMSLFQCIRAAVPQASHTATMMSPLYHTSVLQMARDTGALNSWFSWRTACRASQLTRYCMAFSNAWEFKHGGAVQVLEYTRNKQPRAEGFASTASIHNCICRQHTRGMLLSVILTISSISAAFGATLQMTGLPASCRVCTKRHRCLVLHITAALVWCLLLVHTCDGL